MIPQVLMGLFFLVALAFMLRKVAAPMIQNQAEQSSVPQHSQDSYTNRNS